MSNVVVPFDFSPQSERALGLALRGYPFGSSDTQVDVFHVVDEDLYRRIIGRGAVPSDDAVRSYIGEYVDKQRTPNALPHRITITRGKPVEAIISHINATRCRGVLIGGQGHGGIGEKLMGRTSQRVLRGSKASMYIVKDTTGAFDAQPILCAVDCAAGAKPALRMAQALSEKHGRPLELLMVVEAMVAPYVDMVGDYLEQAVVSAERTLKAFELETLGEARARKRHVRTGAPAHMISRMAAELDVGTIVLGWHGHGATEHLLLGSVSESVAQASAIDVFVVR